MRVAVAPPSSVALPLLDRTMPLLDRTGGLWRLTERVPLPGDRFLALNKLAGALGEKFTVSKREVEREGWQEREGGREGGMMGGREREGGRRRE